jgi:hypothetical protein
MVATLPAQLTSLPLYLTVGDERVAVDSNGRISDKNALAMNLEDPRARVLDQNWTVTFEGALPGFGRDVGNLLPPDTGDAGELVNPDGRFCDLGVQSQQQLVERGRTEAEALRLADYIQIAAALAQETDAYWMDAHWEDTTCSFNTCKDTFGDVDAPLTGRDFVITEAYQDRVALRSRDFALRSTAASPEEERARQALAKCCFPTEMSFNVRAGGQWVVLGSVTSFLHHVIADPTRGVCRDSCDRLKVRQNGRILEAPKDQGGIRDDNATYAFINPMFRFAVVAGDDKSQRDSQFVFTTQGSFSPLLINLATDTKTLIQPVGISVVPIQAAEVAVTDGAINGLTLVSLSSVTATRQFF